MLITMPYLTIKHKTRVPCRSFREERNPVSLTKVKVVMRQIKCPEMFQRALVRCQCPALPCTHSQTGITPINVTSSPPGARDANNQVRQESDMPRIRYAKSRSRAEPALTVQVSPTVRSHQEPQPTDSCKEL